MPYCREQEIRLKDFPVDFGRLAGFINLIESGKVSPAIAYQRLFPALVENPGKDPLELAEILNLLQSEDQGFLEALVDEVIKANPDKVAVYQKGKKGLLGFFMGEVMKKSKGKAEPKATNALLRKKLG